MTTEEQETLALEVASLEEAREQGARHWGLEPDDLDVSVVEEEKRLFGLLGRKLRVEVVPRGPVRQLKVRRFAGDLLSRMELDVQPRITDEGLVNLEGEDAGIVIGRYGETLKALEYLTNLMLHEEAGGHRVRFDCGGYRERREASLTRLAESAARDAVRKGRPISLEPMSSWERRIIHLALKENGDVETRSAGEEPLRKVVVWPKNRKERRPQRRLSTSF